MSESPQLSRGLAQSKGSVSTAQVGVQTRGGGEGQENRGWAVLEKQETLRMLGRF